MFRHKHHFSGSLYVCKTKCVRAYVPVLVHDNVQMHVHVHTNMSMHVQIVHMHVHNLHMHVHVPVRNHVCMFICMYNYMCNVCTFI